MRATALVGNPEETALQLSRLLTPDVDRVTIRPYGFRNQKQDETIRLFAETVWPAAAERALGTAHVQSGG